MTDWQKRWATKATGWDLHGPHPYLHRLTTYFPKKSRVLVPGCGSAHDAAAIAKLGHEVDAFDLVPLAIDNARQYHPTSVHLFVDDALQPKHLTGPYDIVFDRAMLCALSAEDRPTYLQHLGAYCLSGGLFAGILFAEVAQPEKGPPFAMSHAEIHELMHTHWTLLSWTDLPACGPSAILKESVVLWRRR
jgi:SAM-dependent methyltransferase